MNKEKQLVILNLLTSSYCCYRKCDSCPMNCFSDCELIKFRDKITEIIKER